MTIGTLSIYVCILYVIIILRLVSGNLVGTSMVPYLPKKLFVGISQKLKLKIQHYRKKMLIPLHGLSEGARYKELIFLVLFNIR
jgi:hypothetical protein